jgi:hypothetical protein
LFLNLNDLTFSYCRASTAEFNTGVFFYNISATPQITSVSPTEVEAGSILTINGYGFGQGM